MRYKRLENDPKYRQLPALAESYNVNSPGYMVGGDEAVTCMAQDRVYMRKSA